MKTYIILFFIYSIFGFIIEVTNVSLENKRITNRGFLIGPYCPIYGLGAILLTLSLRTVKTNIQLVFLIAIICILTEYSSSFILEKIFKLRWWDYSDKFLNINGRVCLETTVYFIIFGILVIKVLNPLFKKYIKFIPNNIQNAIIILLIIIFLLDCFFSTLIIKKTKKNIKKDATAQIKKEIKNKLIP